MKIFKALTLTSALALTSISPLALKGESLYVHVPFSFVAAGTELPAGDYRVADTGNGTICVQGVGKTVITMTVPYAMSKPGAVPNLRFVSDGHREHLVGVQSEEQIRSLPWHPQEERKLTLSR